MEANYVSEINLDESTNEEMVNWLRSSATRAEVLAVGVIANKLENSPIPSAVVSTNRLLHRLEGADPDALADAIESVFPECFGDDESDEDDGVESEEEGSEEELEEEDDNNESSEKLEETSEE